jgi:hypothetical protein
MKKEITPTHITNNTNQGVNHVGIMCCPFLFQNNHGKKTSHERKKKKRGLIMPAKDDDPAVSISSVSLTKLPSDRDWSVPIRAWKGDIIPILPPKHTPPLTSHLDWVRSIIYLYLQKEDPNHKLLKDIDNLPIRHLASGGEGSVYSIAD